MRRLNKHQMLICLSKELATRYVYTDVSILRVSLMDAEMAKFFFPTIEQVTWDKLIMMIRTKWHLKKKACHWLIMIQHNRHNLIGE